MNDVLSVTDINLYIINVVDTDIYLINVIVKG